MNKLIIAALVSTLSLSAMADAGDVLVRLRAIDVSPQSSWSNSNAVPGLGVSAKSAFAPELDFTYMWTNNIGTELILGTTRHEIDTNMFGSVGKVSVLPPTLTVQYHLAPEATFRPYIGAGINYTRFYNASLDVPKTTALSVQQNRFGPALQIGADIAVAKDWFINVDLKKIWLKTQVTADQLGNANIGTLNIDPLVYGVGIGTKF